MARRDLLRFTDGLLGVLTVLNIVIAALFGLAIVASFPMAAMLVARLAAKLPAADAGAVLVAMRWLLVLGMVAAVPAHAIFTRLRAVVRAVRGGETFAAANAVRVRAVGWALLAIQLLDLPFLWVLRGFETMGVETGGYTPSLGGWLSVLVAFVLARVFAEGAALREDLDGTV